MYHTDIVTIQCHITLHVYDLISVGGGDDGGVRGKEAGKPLTAVQECVSTYVKRTVVQSSALFVATKVYTFDNSGHLQLSLWHQKT